MKKTILLFSALTLFKAFECNAQVQVDRQIQLTGAGTNAKVTGIQQVSSNQDAVSANYIQRDSLKFAIATGSNNAYAVSLNPAITGSYTVGMVVLFEANFTNSGPATLNVNGLGADTIMKNYNTYLASGDLKSGQLAAVMYDGVYFQMLSQLGNSSTVVPHGKQLFAYTGSSQTFTVPAGVTNVWVSMSGGGGGGGYNVGCNSGAGGGGGGGGAAYLAYELSVPLSSYTVTVGGGGATSASSSVNGSNGGSSSFGVLLTANPGKGGGYGVSGGNGGSGGSGGAAGSGGIVGGSGTAGSNLCSGGAGATPGTGGGSMFGSGGGGGYGGGGDGGVNGAPGFVLVEW